MTQTVFTTIDPTTKSGTQLATDLDNFRDSLLTTNAGTTRPSYATAGSVWIANAATPWVLYVYDGADDIELGKINATTNIFTPASVQNSPSTWGGTGGGTVDVITIMLVPTPIAYAAGQKFSFISSGANTTNVTLNVNSLGAKAITKNGTTALVAGDISSGMVVEVQYDGTQFQLLRDAAINIASLATKAAVQGQTYTAYTSAGTSTAFTITPSPAITSNVENMEFDIEFHTAAGTTPTLAVGSGAAASLKYRDSTGTKQAITSTQVPSGWRSKAVFDGTDWIVREVPSTSNGEFRSVQVFVTSGTYTKPAGLVRAKITVVGPGGGGGGGTGGVCGASGGGGGTGIRWLAAASIGATESVVIGAGGAGGAGGVAGTSGSGASSFNSPTITASAGTGGAAGAGGGSAPGIGGVGASGDINISGQSGCAGGNSTNGGAAGQGGSSHFGGGGGGGYSTTAGGNSGAYGGGGGGGGGSAAGGNGADGFCIVEEFF